MDGLMNYINVFLLFDSPRWTELLLLVAMIGHLQLAPFTKVEESFNIQAIHDMNYHRTNLEQYDHLEFPGVVPRTFIGALAVSSVAIYRDNTANAKFNHLLYVRFLLGLAVVISFCGFARSVERHFGETVGHFLRIITATQFHFLFYASRTLPNTFAIVLVLRTFTKFLDMDFVHATAYATVAMFFLRFELVLLFGPLYLVTFFHEGRSFPLVKIVFCGLCSLAVAFCLFNLFDSFLWRRWLWPEGEVIYFNVWLNKSHEYGVLPFLWYFTSAIPRAMLFSLPLTLFGCFITHKREQFLNRRLRSLALPALSFVFLYSFLPHKELRFILYVVPVFNIYAAIFCTFATREFNDSGEYHLLKRIHELFGNTRNWRWTLPIWLGIVTACLIANGIATCGMLFASMQNYPGGVALARLQSQNNAKQASAVHIDVFSAENGVNRFLHRYDSWEYNKTENLPVEAFARFDYLIVGSPTGEISREIEMRKLNETHRIHFSVAAFNGIVWNSGIPRFVYIPKVAVLKRS